VESASLGAGDFTLVLEKLEGDCLRCKVAATTAEVVELQLDGPLRTGRPLYVWLTNSSDYFVQLADIQPASDGTFSVNLPRDTIVTVTTTTGQSKGSHGTPPASGHWQLPYADDYENTSAPRPGRYHADNGGSFEVAVGLDSTDPSNSVLLQAQPVYPGHNGWVHAEPQPTTGLGDGNWRAINISARVLVQGPVPASHLSKEAAAAVGVSEADRHWRGVTWDELVTMAPEEAQEVLPLRTDWRDKLTAGESTYNATFAGIQARVAKRYSSGVYLLVGSGLNASTAPAASCEWELGVGTQSGFEAAPIRLAGGPCPAGVSLTTWTKMELDVGSHRVLRAAVGGTVVASSVLLDPTAGSPLQGLVGYRTGWHYSLFDDLAVEGTTLSTENAFLHSYSMVEERNDFDGFVGMQFHTVQALSISSLGRYCGSRANGTHDLAVFRDNRSNGGSVNRLGGVTLNAASACAEGSKALRADGMAYVPLASDLVLPAFGTYFIVSEEHAGGDTFQGNGDLVQVDLGPVAEAAVDTILTGVYFYE